MSAVKTKNEIHRQLLKNGTTILIKEHHATPIVSVACYFHGGVLFENAKLNGISYFMQKLLLKGTKRRLAEEFAFETEAMGSIIAPFTSKDAFGCHMTMLAKDLDKGCDLLFDALFNPLADPKEVDKERQNIYSEIEEARDDILSYTLELCDKAVFSKHSYGLPIRGAEKSLAAIYRKELCEWHALMYRPDNLVVSVVGDVNISHVIPILERYLSSLSVKKDKFSLPDAFLNRFSPNDILEEREKRQLSLAIGFPAPGIEDKDYIPFDVLNSLLSGMGSRLFIELRDKKGLCYVVSSRYEATKKYGIFKTYIATSPDKEKVSKEGLLEELSKLKYFYVSEKELERAKRYMLGLYDISFQKTVSQALRYARFERVGLGAEMVKKYLSLVEKVTRQDVRRVALQYLKPECAGVVIIRPK